MIRAHLDDRKEIGPVDTDGAVCPFPRFIAVCGIRVVRCSLIVGGQYVFHILYGDLLLRNHHPRNIVGYWCIIGIRSVPFFRVRVQIALHEPGTRCIVNVIGIIVASEGIARIKISIHRKIQMICFNKFFQVC